MGHDGSIVLAAAIQFLYGETTMIESNHKR